MGGGLGAFRREVADMVAGRWGGTSDGMHLAACFRFSCLKPAREIDGRDPNRCCSVATDHVNSQVRVKWRGLAQSRLGEGHFRSPQGASIMPLSGQEHPHTIGLKHTSGLGNSRAIDRRPQPHPPWTFSPRRYDDVAFSRQFSSSTLQEQPSYPPTTFCIALGRLSG